MNKYYGAITYSIFSLLAYLAVNGNSGAGNLLKFSVWLLAIILICGTVAGFKGEPMSTTLDKIYTVWNLTIVGFLVWHGWIFTGIAFLLVLICKAISSLK
jgi:hypothetical protein